MTSAMKLLVLVTCLAGILQAKVVHRHLDILEGEATYRQTVTIDYDKNIQIVEVPAHNNIVHSRTIFDFNKGKLVESHPESKTCYVRDIPEETADLKTFDDYLQNTTVPLTANKQRHIRKAYKVSKRIDLKMFPDVAAEIVDECSQSDVYETIEVPRDMPVKTTRNKVSYDYGDMVGDGEMVGGCKMPDNCIWQTCKISDDDSCYYTVQCQPQQDQNEDDCYIYHSNILHHGDVHIKCEICWNMKCDGCASAWNDCTDTIGANVKPCDEDPTIGGDCEEPGRPRCHLPHWDFQEAVKKGFFDCTDTIIERGFLEVDESCPYVCNNEKYGGYVVCTVDPHGPGLMDDEGVFNTEKYKPDC